jgi:hypothetical protein
MCCVNILLYLLNWILAQFVNDLNYIWLNYWCRHTLRFTLLQIYINLYSPIAHKVIASWITPCCCYYHVTVLCLFICILIFHARIRNWGEMYDNVTSFNFITLNCEHSNCVYGRSVMRLFYSLCIDTIVDFIYRRDLKVLWCSFFRTSATQLHSRLQKSENHV